MKELYNYFERYSRIFKVIAMFGYFDKEKKRWMKHPVNKKWSLERNIVNEETKNILKSGKANAIAIVPSTAIDGNSYICFDCDIYKLDENQRKKYEKAIDYLREITYVEKTPSGGYHIFFKRKNNESFLSYCNEIEIRDNGLVIVYPSQFSYFSGKYELLSKIKYVDECAFVTQDLVRDLDVDVLGENNLKKKINNNINVEAIQTVRQRFDFLKDLSADDLVRFLFYYAQLLRCYGFAKALAEFLNSGKIPVPSYEVNFMKIPRGSHCVTEWILFQILFDLGASKEALVELAQKIDYIDGVHNSSPLHNLIYNVFKGKTPIPRFCPFKHLCENKLCSLSPYHRVNMCDSSKYLAKKILECMRRSGLLRE